MNAWDGAVGLPAALAIFAAVGLRYGIQGIKSATFKPFQIFRSLPSLPNRPLVLLAGLFNIGVQV